MVRSSFARGVDARGCLTISRTPSSVASPIPTPPGLSDSDSQESATASRERRRVQLAARAAADAIAAPMCDRMEMLEQHVNARLGAVESRLPDVQLAVFTMSENFAVLSQQLQMRQNTCWCPMVPVCQP